MEPLTSRTRKLCALTAALCSRLRLPWRPPTTRGEQDRLWRLRRPRTSSARCLLKYYRAPVGSCNDNARIFYHVRKSSNKRTSNQLHSRQPLVHLDITMRSWFGRGKPLRIAVTSCCLTAFVLFGYDQGTRLHDRYMFKAAIDPVNRCFWWHIAESGLARPVRPSLRLSDWLDRILLQSWLSRGLHHQLFCWKLAGETACNLGSNGIRPCRRRTADYCLQCSPSDHRPCCDWIRDGNEDIDGSNVSILLDLHANETSRN